MNFLQMLTYDLDLKAWYLEEPLSIYYNMA